MSSKKKIQHIKPPETNDRVDQLRYLAQIRGELPVEEEKPRLNVKKFLIISCIVLLVLAGAFLLATVRLNAINAYNAAIEAGTITGEIDVTASTWILVRVLALVLAGVYALFMLVKLAHPKRRKPNRSFWGDLGIYLLMLLFAVAMVFPLVFSICSALKPLDELFRFPPKVFPSHVTMDNFSDLFVTMSQSWIPFSDEYCIHYVCRYIRACSDCFHGCVCACKIRFSRGQAVLLCCSYGTHVFRVRHRDSELCHHEPDGND